ncbi:hypothetical protein WJX77_011508 [Trebouxia sp. C0004]
MCSFISQQEGRIIRLKLMPVLDMGTFTAWICHKKRDIQSLNCNLQDTKPSQIQAAYGMPFLTTQGQPDVWPSAAKVAEQ